MQGALDCCQLGFKELGEIESLYLQSTKFLVASIALEHSTHPSADISVPEPAWYGSCRGCGPYIIHQVGVVSEIFQHLRQRMRQRKTPFRSVELFQCLTIPVEATNGGEEGRRSF